MKKDKDDYMNNFQENLKVLHKDYRNLELQHKDLTSIDKLEKEIQDKLAIKESLRQECETIDAGFKSAVENYNKQKQLDQELSSELEFLQEQVNESQHNDHKLKIRQKDLSNQLAELTG
jgi:DNA repair exonuclease SbcCD ATPase subunit